MAVDRDAESEVWAGATRLLRAGVVPTVERLSMLCPARSRECLEACLAKWYLHVGQHVSKLARSAVEAGLLCGEEAYDGAGGGVK